ncbi:SH2 domain-containing adapter protein D [Echinops telfairi]|uniref:SH2 domain-containing adapter protein D n=1 Tax=Echinops telfairi TaxID=9371 RepID=A0ABM0ZT95_ECHTE|nr:SH2 domain-containing adapter protein D [Echinops telfairi]
MAKWLRDYLSFGGRRPPPQPPTPDYSESDILRAYREQKNLDFEDPYEDADSRQDPDPTGPGDPTGPADSSKYDSPKHRLIKVDASDMAKAKAFLDSPEEEVRELPGRVVQLYDTPYEEQDQEAGEEPLSGGQKPLQSRLPQEDERPAEEYDQPWEWKKEHISRAFAGAISSPLPRWFHGPLSRADAENLLSLCREGSYLVRLSETSPQDCSLSLRSSQGFLHLKFARIRENQVVLGQHSGLFPSVPELLLHYSARPLPVQGAEHLALLYPVTTTQPP